MTNTLSVFLAFLSWNKCLASGVITVSSANVDQHPLVRRAQSSDTCLFNNQIFQRGESYGDSFVTRCGSAADFPCYCNPDLSPPIECNYCSFALQNGGLLCARDEEIVRFTDIKGVDQTCSCQVASGMDPSAECTVGFDTVDDSTTNDNEDKDTGNDSGSNNGNAQDETSCLVALPNGSEKIIPNGEYIYEGEKANICDDDFPCLCNMGQVECPYCTFNAINDDVVCARDKESVIFEGQDFKIRSCTCQLDVNSTDGNTFSSDCTELTSAPSVAPTAGTSLPTSDPYVIVDLDCQVKDGEGNIVVVEHGTSFGSLVTGKCGSAEEWPSFCNKRSSPTFSRNSLQDDVEYPYCIFDDTYSGSTVCARDNEEVTFLDNNGFLLACRCRAPNGYGPGAMTTCRDASEQQTTFTWSPTEAPKVNSSATTIRLLSFATVASTITFLLLPISF